jgi:hypothetical protein
LAAWRTLMASDSSSLSFAQQAAAEIDNRRKFLSGDESPGKSGLVLEGCPASARCAPVAERSSGSALVCNLVHRH